MNKEGKKKGNYKERKRERKEKEVTGYWENICIMHIC